MLGKFVDLFREEGDLNFGKNVDVVVSRVIQKATGRILFAKKI